jgi:hypothetical protein
LAAAGVRGGNNDETTFLSGEFSIHFSSPSPRKKIASALRRCCEKIQFSKVEISIKFNDFLMFYGERWVGDEMINKIVIFSIFFTFFK